MLTPLARWWKRHLRARDAARSWVYTSSRCTGAVTARVAHTTNAVRSIRTHRAPRRRRRRRTCHAVIPTIRVSRMLLATTSTGSTYFIVNLEKAPGARTGIYLRQSPCGVVICDMDNLSNHFRFTVAVWYVDNVAGTLLRLQIAA